MDTCTTNGTSCTLRKLCSDCTDINGCITDKNGNSCFWTGSTCVSYDCEGIPTG